MASAIFQLKNQQLLDLQNEKIINMHIKKKDILNLFLEFD